jgi:molybdopterin-guanine dinucleotide biosynthesis protein A
MLAWRRYRSLEKVCFELRIKVHAHPKRIVGLLTEQMSGNAGAISTTSAVVLAGGKSQRLGLDKSLLELGGEPILKRILQKLAELSDDRLVVANRRQELAHLNVPIIADARPGMGPLGGIYSGLQAMRYERGLFVACDMPFLNVPLLQYMVRQCPEFDVVILRIGHKTEALCAIYSKGCLPAVADLLDHGQTRIVDFFPQVRVHYIERAEVEAFDPEHRSFFNINTRADLERAQQLNQQDKLSA